MYAAGLCTERGSMCTARRCMEGEVRGVTYSRQDNVCDTGAAQRTSRSVTEWGGHVPEMPYAECVVGGGAHSKAEKVCGNRASHGVSSNVRGEVAHGRRAMR